MIHECAGVMTDQKKREYYDALVNKDAGYEGVFFAGIKTTGIFCRPTCPARKPKYVNCEFFKSAQDALLAGYRSCKRCHPLAYPDKASGLIKTLIEAVEADPERRWSDADFRSLSVDASTVRRQFKKRFGMTFVAYARARRMGLALQHIREGGSVMKAQLGAGYESGSGFRDAFSRIMGAAPNTMTHTVFKAAWLDTPLGPMIAVADDRSLYMLEFTDRRGLELEVERMRKRLKASVVPGDTAVTVSIEKEMGLYFSGKIQAFKTPIAYIGSEFQKTVWDALQRIPYGQTMSYAGLAKKIKKPKAFRAVARANGTNQLAIIIPCHRIIQSEGGLGGYGGGVERKKWLIGHEKNQAHSIKR